MSAVTVTYEIEQAGGVVLLLVNRSLTGGGTHSEGIRIPFDQIEDAIQALTDAARDADRPSSAAETVNGGVVCYCGEPDVYDGYADCPMHPRGG